MSQFLIREATIKDVDFLVESIIAAERSGSQVFSYSAFFGLSEEEAKVLIKEMLEEEIDDCDLSLSGFLVVEYGNELVAASNVWIEGNNGIASSTIKGNLLGYYLPSDALKKAKEITSMFADLSIELKTGCMYFGPAYVRPDFEGNLLLSQLVNAHFERNNTIVEAFAPIYGNNQPSIQNFKLLNFKVYKTYTTSWEGSEKFLPSSTKLLMNKKLK